MLVELEVPYPERLQQQNIINMVSLQGETRPRWLQMEDRESAPRLDRGGMRIIECSAMR